MRPPVLPLLVAAVVAAIAPAVAADTAPAGPTRTVYRCIAGGTVSLATAPEPGSRCKAITFDANAAKLPDLWGTGGANKGVLWQRQQDGKTVYSTRELPGSVRVLAFTVPAPPGSKAHVGLGDLGAPRWDVFEDAFRDAARSTGVDEAWLRAIAHVESGFVADAVSSKGAAGVMQLMPDTAADYEVTDRLDPNQSIQAGARHLRDLIRRYPDDLRKVAAAYNAGASVVDAYGGVPPYAETQAYVEKALELHRRYLGSAR
jgi:soluble lytic murein transglycosylase-like protein